MNVVNSSEENVHSMCGRFTLVSEIRSILDDFKLPTDISLPARYNIAPSQLITAITRPEQDGAFELAQLRWGLIPRWAKDPRIGQRGINARAETVAEKPSFRAAFKRRRALVLADGYYEWKKVGEVKGKVVKQPYYIRLKSQQPFTFAALWEEWRPRDRPVEQVVRSCSLLTTEPSPSVEQIHHRMPVILPKRSHSLWFSAESPREALESLLGPYDDAESGLEAFPVSRHVNNPRHNGPELIEPQS